MNKLHHIILVTPNINYFLIRNILSNTVEVEGLFLTLHFYSCGHLPIVVSDLVSEIINYN